MLPSVVNADCVTLYGSRNGERTPSLTANDGVQQGTLRQFDGASFVPRRNGAAGAVRTRRSSIISWGCATWPTGSAPTRNGFHSLRRPMTATSAGRGSRPSTPSARWGRDIGAQRVAFAAAAVPDFAALFGLGNPNAIRRAAAQDTPPDAPVAIIKSETGSGKTAAALQSSRAAVVRQALETVPRGF